MSNSTTPSVDSRPPKPSKGYPLFAHRSGQWCKKIKCRSFYFGSWRKDPRGEAALEQFEFEWPYLKRGQDPPAIITKDGIDFKDLCNTFLEAKEAAVKDGEISELTFLAYVPTSKRLCDYFGKLAKVESITPKGWTDYRSKLVQRFAPTTLSTEVAKIKALFGWGKTNKLHAEIEFGSDFKRASGKLMRQYKKGGGKKCFAREELLAILDASDCQMRALVLCGVNAAFGNSDLGTLPESALDLESGWVDYSRVKTGVSRRTPLWKETIQALCEWLPRRPKPTSEEAVGKVFLTKDGTCWTRSRPHADVLSPRFRRLLTNLKINSRRSLGFYSLRHTSATIASEAKDPQAVAALLGHIDQTQSAVYIESISDERLLAVVDVVRVWLFGEGDKTNET